MDLSQVLNNVSTHLFIPDLNSLLLVNKTTNNVVQDLLSKEDFYFRSIEVFIGTSIPERMWKRNIWRCIWNTFQDIELNKIPIVPIQAPDTIELILLSGYDPSLWSCSLLRDACEKGDIDSVKLLLQDERVDPLCKMKIMDDNLEKKIAESFSDNFVHKLGLVIKVSLEQRNIWSADVIEMFGENREEILKLMGSPRFTATPIGIAIICQETEILDLFLNMKRVTDLVSVEEVIYTSLLCNCLDIFAFLIKNRKPVDTERLVNEVSQLHNLSPRLISILIENSIDLFCSDNILLRKSCLNGNVDCVKMLLELPEEMGIDPTCNRNECIKSASSGGYVDIVRMLLPRVNPELNDCSCFRSAVKSGKLEVVKLLLTNPRINPCVRDNQCIRRTYKKQYYDVVDELLKDERVRSSLTPKKIEKYITVRKRLRNQKDMKQFGKVFISFAEKTGFGEEARAVVKDYLDLTKDK